MLITRSSEASVRADGTATARDGAKGNGGRVPRCSAIENEDAEGRWGRGTKGVALEEAVDPPAS
ncbi:MAG: hypothetical protein KA791_12925 [Flavobacteriales bacterium]|nr:hypothetical protein [Flavobacteriales bacterium]